MAKPGEKLAASLSQLEKLQKAGRRVFRSNELTRVHRERLLRNGFLLEVMKGWLISSSPGSDPGDTTPWFATFWEFFARYCTARFGSRWHLSPEQSLLLHAGNTVIPCQIVVYAPKAANNTVELPFGHSLYDLKQRQMPPENDLCEREGLRLFVVEAALLKIPEIFYTRRPAEALVLLSGVRDASDILHRVLESGQTVIAGRIAGAFRRIGRAEVADEIVDTMKSAGFDVRESDPFAPKQMFGALSRRVPPFVGRLRATWEILRDPIITLFPKAPGLPQDREAYMRSIDEIYRSDAYHSLSIEGYQVTPDLIERVRYGDWDPDENDEDRQSRDALAARGYWQAFGLVREALREIILGGEAGGLVCAAHREWHRGLFQPFVTAGLAPPSMLAGYRNDSVFLRGSRYVPPRPEIVRDAMPALFELLEKESESSVRAVLGHWMFGYIHPYSDGNGRLARFIMNAMLASGGYPWTVIRLEDRDAYLEALEAASIEQNIEPFARFVARRVEWSLERGAMTRDE